jgi:hypothetical protein
VNEQFCHRRLDGDVLGWLLETGGIMKYFNVACGLLLLTGIAAAQDKAKPRVFVTDSDSWQVVGRAGAIRPGGAGVVRGGAEPQTVEIIKTVGDECKTVTVTMKQENADYILRLDHEGGKRALQKDNKFAVFNKDGDAIKSGSTRALKNSVKDACKALMEDWKTH